ncbi:DMT family transporter [Amycolatopsis jiangsuensis]|uniref:Drug/metabolite transporter (DMT)-like permease n=1 Tax=Amycolatopsis jiangsuensis TaxID=1181879 RepID=A0A840IN36_9PSEU|nr:DMT family transporter [Amycolatopsis jiangsuensis]MBB4683303.1 drug/metabolite transporter (DMT)-like permease [Amycolatopsis jiangsuensis]
MTTTELHSTPPAGPIAAFTAQFDPRLLAAAGSLCVALSSVFIKISGASGATSSFWRCLFALPVLALLARTEARRTGVRTKLVPPLLAGLGLGLDFVLWGEAIPRVGAGIATVLLAVQVVIVPVLAFAFLADRPDRRFLVTAPVLIGGIVLAGGFIGTTVTGPDPVLGALSALAAGAGYSVYLLLIRFSSGPSTQVRSLLLATVSAGAVAVLLGVPFHRLDFTPGWPAFGWFVALSLIGQVAGWLLIAGALPRMSSATGATLMLLQPVGAVVFGIVLLGEEPSVLQLTGCAVVLAAVCFAGRGARR